MDKHIVGDRTNDVVFPTNSSKARRGYGHNNAVDY